MERLRRNIIVARSAGARGSMYRVKRARQAALRHGGSRSLQRTLLLLSPPVRRSKRV